MTKKTWEPVEQTFEALKTHLQDHFATVGTDLTAEQRSLQKSVRGLINSVEDGITAVRDSIADPVVRRDLAVVGKTLRAALTESFDAAGAQARQRLSRGPAMHAHHAAAAKSAAKPAAARKTATKTASKTATKRAPAKKAAS